MPFKSNLYRYAAFNDAVESLCERHVTYVRAFGRFLRTEGEKTVDRDAWGKKQLGMVAPRDNTQWGVPAERLKPDVGPSEVGLCMLNQVDP